MPRRPRLAVLLAPLALVAAGCGDGGGSPDPPGAAGGAEAAGAGAGRAGRVRLGYFPNITHATAIVGAETGIFREELGTTELAMQTFNAGPAAVEALLSGALDATYIGPNPAINAFTRSRGAVRIVSGATSGGAFLVVDPSIGSARDLRGRKVASPQLGGTQDVALRHWLDTQGLTTDPQGGGDVSIVPQENAQTLETFRSGAIHGAWVPEPWATRLVREGGGRVLVDERDLWPDRRFVTTHLLVRSRFLEDHPGTVRDLLRGQVRANALVNGDPARAQALVNEGIGRVTGKRLAPDVIAAAWEGLEFTNDPVAASLTASAEHARSVGLLEEVDLDGIYDMGPLNDVLAAAGQQELTAP